MKTKNQLVLENFDFRTLTWKLTPSSNRPKCLNVFHTQYTPSLESVNGLWHEKARRAKLKIEFKICGDANGAHTN